MCELSLKYLFLLRWTGFLATFPSGDMSGWLGVVQLQEIPPVPIEIDKHGDRAVRFAPRLLCKHDPARPHVVIVAPEVIRLEEQKNAPARLIANAALLLRSHGPGKEQRSSVRAPRADNHPSLAFTQLCVLDQFEP